MNLKCCANIQSSKKTKVNMNDTTIEQLMDLLTKHRLTDPDDMAFIETKFLKHETVLEKACNSEEDVKSTSLLTFYS